MIKIPWIRLKPFIDLFSPLDTTRKNSWKFKLPNKVERKDFPKRGMDGKENGREFSVFKFMLCQIQKCEKELNKNIQKTGMSFELCT